MLGAKNTMLVKEDVKPESGSTVVKIMSYNLWFREDLELRKRMKTIGDLIQLHSPDLICFQVISVIITCLCNVELSVTYNRAVLQEVTPKIYDLLSNSSWWKVYRCSVSKEMSDSKPYYCMLVSF